MEKKLNTYIFVCISVFFMISFSSCTSKPLFSENKSLYGKIIDMDNNSVQNAKIILNNKEISNTDFQGNFSFQNIKQNTNSVQVFTALYQPFTEVFDLGTENRFIQIRLKEMSCFIENAKTAFLQNDILETKKILYEAIEINPLFQPSYIFLINLCLFQNEKEELKQIVNRLEKENISKQDIYPYIINSEDFEKILNDDFFEGGYN